MGGVIGGESPRNSSPASKLERKMVEAMKQRALKGTSVKSFNSVIMKFPKIDESLRNCKTIFQQFGELYITPQSTDIMPCHLKVKVLKEIMDV